MTPKSTERQQVPRPSQRASIELSEDAWPIVRVVFAGAVTPSALRDFLADVSDVAARAERDAEPVALLMILESINPAYISAPIRRELAAMTREVLPRLENVIRAEARIVHRPVLRGVVTAMNWLVPFPWTVATFETEEEGERWLRVQLAPRSAR